MPARRRAPQGCGPLACSTWAFFPADDARQTSCYSSVWSRNRMPSYFCASPGGRPRKTLTRRRGRGSCRRARWQIGGTGGARCCRHALARISHQLSAAASDSGMSTALRSVGRLDVLSSTPAAPSGRAPCIHARLRRLATKPGEKSGLGVFLPGLGWCARSLRIGEGLQVKVRRTH
jgi:hypothetical protein